MSIERNHKIQPEQSLGKHNESSRLHAVDNQTGKHKISDSSEHKDQACKKHLPSLELVDHKRLQEKLVDTNHKHKAADRLHAAHKLYSNNEKEFSVKDKKGDHHYKIVEKHNEKNNSTKVAVFEVATAKGGGQSIRLTLEGTLTASGKFEEVKDHQRRFTKRSDHSEKDSTDHEESHSRRQRHHRHARASHHNQIESYSSKVERQIFDSTPGTFKNLPSDKLIKLDNGMVYLRSKLAVDADGGSDWRNDPYGQAMTSLTHKDGSALDANKTNYFVLPMTDDYKQMGIKLGDLAWVRNIRTGKMVAAIFGDHGPNGKIGEGSQALCRALGLSGDPNSGGTDKKEIEFFIQPNSGNGKGDIAKNERAMVAKLSPLETPSTRGSVSARIVACAEAAEGDKLWLSHAGATQNGRLGCAISTSEVLSNAGLDINKETSAYALTTQLQGRGWNRIAVSQARPGDIIYGVKPGTVEGSGGGNAHIGIVGEHQDGKLMVFANVSKTGRWTHETASRGFSPKRFGNQIWAFTPPQSAGPIVG